MIKLADKFKESHIVVPWGCDYSFNNAKTNYQQTEALINYINEHYNTSNVKVIMSTPSEYLNAIAKEREAIEYRTFHSDFIPFLQDLGDAWTGYFSSVPGFKSNVRTTSALFHAQNKKFALKVLEKDVKNETVDKLLSASRGQLDVLGIFNNEAQI